MKIIVIDGQGGKMGHAVIVQLKKSHPELEITAIGTNSIATSSMLKAGADAVQPVKIPWSWPAAAQILLSDPSVS